MAIETQEREIYMPGKRLWTVAEFDRAGRLGIFRPGERLELIEGEVVKKVAPQKSPHATSIRAVEIALGRAFLSGFDVRCQMPLVFGTRNKPEPDISVVAGSFRDYTRKHPTTAILVVEVSDSTLRLDRTRKAPIYARAQIQEYWIINLVDRILEVHRDPTSGEYREIARYVETDRVSPLASPDISFEVSELLP
jgi:Uma2 family endonuclease